MYIWHLNEYKIFFTLTGQQMSMSTQTSVYVRELFAIEKTKMFPLTILSYIFKSYSLFAKEQDIKKHFVRQLDKT